MWYKLHSFCTCVWFCDARTKGQRLHCMLYICCHFGIFVANCGCLGWGVFLSNVSMLPAHYNKNSLSNTAILSVTKNCFLKSCPEIQAILPDATLWCCWLEPSKTSAKTVVWKKGLAKKECLFLNGAHSPFPTFVATVPFQRYCSSVSWLDQSGLANH